MGGFKPMYTIFMLPMINEQRINLTFGMEMDSFCCTQFTLTMRVCVIVRQICEVFFNLKF